MSSICISTFAGAVSVKYILVHSAHLVYPVFKINTLKYFPRGIVLFPFYQRHNTKILKMTGVLDAPKTRINCSMLSQYTGRPVCFLGRADKVHPTGKMFKIFDGEGKVAQVELNEPLEEEVSGTVEVIGVVSNKGTIMATTYNILREDKGIAFDLELYNEALKVIHDYPQYYPFQVAASE